MRTIHWVFVSVLFYVIYCSPVFAQENKVWEDGRIGVILEKIKRTTEYPSEWRMSGNQYLPPKEGHDYVVVYFTIEMIKNIHLVSFGGREHEKSILRSANGKKYKLDIWQSKGLRFKDPNPNKLGGPYEYVKGAKGIMTFTFPKQKKATDLTFVYYFKETWEDNNTRVGKIDIPVIIN